MGNSVSVRQSYREGLLAIEGPGIGNWQLTERLARDLLNELTNYFDAPKFTARVNNLKS